MGPGMSARNIALLRSHWTSTILPISVSQTQRSAGLLLGAAHGVFWIMSLASAFRPTVSRTPL